MKNFILAFKLAYNIPTLPSKILYFHNHIFTRIFRFIGGISILITVSRGFDYINIQEYFNELISDMIIFTTFILASIFIIFILIINLIKIVYGIYLLIKKPEIFEVRNSPLNLLATYLGKLLYCVKIGCVVSGTTAAVVAGGVTFDTLIEKSGRGPIFVPMMAEGLNLILGKPTEVQNVKLPEVSSNDSTSTDFSQDNINDALNKYQSLSLSEKDNFWKEVSKEFNKNK
jgi:hypothetical protein